MKSAAKTALAWIVAIVLVLFPAAWPVGNWHRIDQPTEVANRSLQLKLSRLNYGCLPEIRPIYAMFRAEPASTPSYTLPEHSGEYTCVAAHYEPICAIYFVQLSIAGYLIFRILRSPRR
jgi:hypothetical protein